MRSRSTRPTACSSTAGFGFDEARALVDYLDELGVTDVYASPYLRPRPGSTHGYDVVDHDAAQPRARRRATPSWPDRRARARGAWATCVDFVPNHMGIAPGRTRGGTTCSRTARASLYADYFDIDWASAEAGAPRARCSCRSSAPVRRGARARRARARPRGRRVLRRYYERRLPAGSAHHWLRSSTRRRRATRALPEDDPRLQELESIVTGPAPPARARTRPTPTRREERAREKEVIKRRLAALVPRTCAEIAEAIDAAVAELNGTPGDPRELRRARRASCASRATASRYWRVATEEINYRRFFDINELAAIRMERPAVFDARARAPPSPDRARGASTGLRLDHTDGLYDPHAYFAKLQERAGEALPRRADAPRRRQTALRGGREDPRARRAAARRLADRRHHRLRVPSARVNGLWVDRAAEAALTAPLRSASPATRRPSPSTARAASAPSCARSLSSEIHMLAQRARAHRRGATGARATSRSPSLHRAPSPRPSLRFPVYRTYVRADGSREPDDERTSRRATRLARRRNPAISASVFDFLARRAPAATHGHRSTEAPAAHARVRDALPAAHRAGDGQGRRGHRVLPLPPPGLAQRGGRRPDRFGVSVGRVPRRQRAALRAGRCTMTTTSTHDTKRGEDVRARIAVLTEMPGPGSAGTSLARRAAPIATATDDGRGRRRVANDEYLFYQTVVGACPLRRDVERAVRRARRGLHAQGRARGQAAHLAGSTPTRPTSRRSTAFVRGMLADAAFVDDLARARRRAIAPYGAANSLAQALLQLASPGVPDTYQGSELWDLSLVDPDNRRPVDYGALRAAAPADPGRATADLLASFPTARVEAPCPARGARACAASTAPSSSTATICRSTPASTWWPSRGRSAERTWSASPPATPAHAPRRPRLVDRRRLGRREIVLPPRAATATRSRESDRRRAPAPRRGVRRPPRGAAVSEIR